MINVCEDPFPPPFQFCGLYFGLGANIFELACGPRYEKEVLVFSLECGEGGGGGDAKGSRRLRKSEASPGAGGVDRKGGEWEWEGEKGDKGDTGENKKDGEDGGRDGDGGENLERRGRGWRDARVVPV